MKTFEELELIVPVQRALSEAEYRTPTPIQAQTIPAALQERDVLGCAQTGTGKTAAFALPILNRLGQCNRRSSPNLPFVLVLAPTRELAIQIEESFATYGRHLKLRQAVVCGGVNQRQQVRAMNRGVHILVATPGRLLDLMQQGHIELDQLKVFVLDEADRMLDMGFLPDLKKIIRKLPARRQSLFFSATLPANIIRLSQRLLTDPVSVNVAPESKTVEKIDQRVILVDQGDKRALLREILKDADIERALVFTRTKRGANMLAQQLARSGFKTAAIHGNKSQGARQRALEAFRRRQVQVLVATDVVARGIDIERITHVVNFDLPMEPEAYVHRIGRTGRAGSAGIALSFCCPDQRRELKAIERLIGEELLLEDGGRQPVERRRLDGDSKRSTSQSSHVQRAARGTRPGSGSGNSGQKRRRRKRNHLRQRGRQTN